MEGIKNQWDEKPRIGSEESWRAIEEGEKELKQREKEIKKEEENIREIHVRLPNDFLKAIKLYPGSTNTEKIRNVIKYSIKMNEKDMLLKEFEKKYFELHNNLTHDVSQADRDIIQISKIRRKYLEDLDILVKIFLESLYKE